MEVRQFCQLLTTHEGKIVLVIVNLFSCAMLLALLHLNFIDNAVLVFAKLTSLVRCMIVKMSQRLPRRFLVLTDSVTFHYPPILQMRLRRLLVHHTTIAHHAIICH